MLADLRSGSLSRSGDETWLAEPGSRLLRERTAPAAVATTQLCCDTERFGADRLRERVHRTCRRSTRRQPASGAGANAGRR
jgi:hypothetical protein